MAIRVRSPFLVVLAALLLIASPSRAQTAFSGLEPVAGDGHQHSGSLLNNYTIYRNLAAVTTRCPHAFGSPLDLLDRHRTAGYDFAILSHHDRATGGGITGDPSGSGPFGSPVGAYSWWTDPASQPITKTDGTPVIVPDPSGLADYLLGGTVTPGWNESKSFSSAAELRNDPAGGFVAFSGREYTTTLSTAQSSAARQGGHKIVVLPGTTDRICGPLEGFQGAVNECDETELYRWVRDQGGAIIQAHPSRGWASGMIPWHPAMDPAGMTDVFVQGVEVAKSNQVVWEHAFQRALRNGYRLFPSFGSDLHKTGLNEIAGLGCSGNSSIGPVRGGLVCWVPQGGMTRQTILDAMYARNCYASTGYKPVLKYEMKDSPTDPPVPMGSELDSADGEVTILVIAMNDLANQSGGSDARFDLLELVDADGAVVASHACVRDDVLGDFCDLNTTLNIADGPLYPRICEFDGNTGCITNGGETRLVGAPIFLNWTAYKASQGVTTDPSCDFDSDGVACFDDNCWLDVNAGQADADGDGVGDACDNCPATSNPSQADGNGDGTGDACQSGDSDGDGFPDAEDTCPATYNANQQDSDGDGFGFPCDVCPTVADPDQADEDLDGVGDACDSCTLLSNPRLDLASVPAYRTTTGGQLDDDGDGFGNICDGDFVAPSPLIDAADRDQIEASIPAGGPLPSTDEATCGTTGSVSCDRFDLQNALGELGVALDELDVAHFGLLETSFPTPEKCTPCGVDFKLLPCVGDACIACSDGLDNDGDYLIDFPDDPGCNSASDPSEEPECSDGLDNDGDGLIDFAGGDPECGSALDASESAPACSDGFDNDGDGFTDLSDPGCDDGSESAETSPLLPCDDGIDNDGDGRIDFDPVTKADPSHTAGVGDPGCANPGWPQENSQCQDGVNNDGDDLIDFDGGQSIYGECVAGICSRKVSDPDEDGIANPDPQCVGGPWRSAESPSCGLGFELALLLPPLLWLRARRRRLR